MLMRGMQLIRGRIREKHKEKELREKEESEN